MGNKTIYSDGLTGIFQFPFISCAIKLVNQQKYISRRKLCFRQSAQIFLRKTQNLSNRKI